MTAADRQACVDRVNNLRAGIGRRALSHSAPLDAFGDQAATNDGNSGVAHQYWSQTGGGGNLSLAANEVLRYSTIEFGSVQGVIKVANDLFWAEGPSGGHYQNIADNQWTQLGCGFGINGQNVTYTTEFR